MSHCHREDLAEIVIRRNADGARTNADCTRPAAEVTVTGNDLTSDTGLPDAHGRTCRLPRGPIFAPGDGPITRLEAHGTFQDGLREVGG